MPVGAEAAGYGGSALAYASGTGRAGMMGYDVGDADLFEASTSRQQLLETSRASRVSYVVAVIIVVVVLIVLVLSVLLHALMIVQIDSIDQCKNLSMSVFRSSIQSCFSVSYS